MKIGIVGGAGQIGRGLLRAFRQHPGISAFGITRNAMSAGPLLAEGFDIRVGSVADGTTARDLLQGADVVVNCALEIDRPKRARARNEALVSGLLEHAHAALVIHLSSVAVYGSCVDRTVSTFERPRPDSTYGREKLRLERFAQSVAPRHRQPLLMLRLGHVYGPGQGISREAFDVLKAGQWTLPFDGALPSNAVHIDHLAAAIPTMADRTDGGVVLNATDSPQRTWRQLYDLHAEAARAPRLPSMADGDAERLRARFRREARLPLVRRVGEQVSGWARQLPLKSLVSVTAVRQATEAALLALPAGLERLVDRRYMVFSAGLHMDRPGGAEGPPPWFYSDGVTGPGLPEAAESAERTAREVAELRAWHATWAAPLWRIAAGRESSQ